MSTNLPLYYDDACKALAACVRIDEVKVIRDKAIAMERYARQIKDARLAEAVAAIKWRAMCRYAELHDEQRKAGKLAKGSKGQGRPSKKAGFQKPHLKERTLSDQGIDKNLAKLVRSAGRMTEAQRVQHGVKLKRMAVAVVEGNAAVIKAAKAEQHAQKMVARAAREAALAGKILALPQKKYGVIYADPEWHFETYSVEGTLGTSAQDHYPTSDLETIKARVELIDKIAAKDCALFLWATVPMLLQAGDVMRDAWRFTYKSHYVWDKGSTGTGYWGLNRHEILLVGTRGNIPAPAPGTLWESVIYAPRGRHSETPEIFYELIESYFPNLPKIELNARKRRKGWDAWGLEAPEIDEAAE